MFAFSFGTTTCAFATNGQVPARTANAEMTLRRERMFCSFVCVHGDFPLWARGTFGVKTFLSGTHCPVFLKKF